MTWRHPDRAQRTSRRAPAHRTPAHAMSLALHGSAARLVALVTTFALALVVAVVGGLAPSTASAADVVALTLTKTASVSQALPGDHVTWSIDVTCQSLDVMCDTVVVTDAVPEPFVVDAGGVSVGGERTGHAVPVVNGNDVSVALQETSPNHPGVIGLRDGQSVTVVIESTLPAGTGLDWDGRNVVNTAHATAANTAPVSDDAPVAIVVPVVPSVAVTKSWTPTDQVAGRTEDITLALGVRNTSPVPATGLTLTDPVGGTTPFGPGEDLVLTGFGDWNLPAGATSLTVDLVTASGTTTMGTYTDDSAPIAVPGGTDLSAVTGVVLRFAGDPAVTDGSIAAGGAAGGVQLIAQQSATIPRDRTTQVPNTARGDVATTPGAATGTASAQFQANLVTVEVGAAKTINGVASAAIVAGDTAVVDLRATNASNTALSTLTVTEPASLAATPLGATADGKVAFDGFGTAGDGQVAADRWPTGADGATVEFLAADGSSLGTGTVVAPATGATSVTWPDKPASGTVAGFVVTYTGTLVAGTSAGVPFRVSTDATWTEQQLLPNSVRVDGATATDAAAPASASANLTVNPRRVVTSTTKLLDQAVGTVPGAVGQELVAAITGRISADTTVPVGSLVIEDVAPDPIGDSLWGSARLDRIASVAVPAGTQVTVEARVAGSWTTVVQNVTNATDLLNLAVPAGADGVRLTYLPLGSATALPATLAPTVKLVFALTSTVPQGTRLSNAATTTGTGTGAGAGLSDTSAGQPTIGFGPGTDPVDIRRVDASKSWRDSQALIPFDNATGGAAVERPANRFTLTAQNISGIPVDTLRLVDPIGTTDNVFDLVDVTHISVTPPSGTQATVVTLHSADGSQSDFSEAQAEALTAADLADVTGIDVQVTGHAIPDSARLVVDVDTVLRAETRSGAAISGGTDAAPSTAVTNTVRGDFGPATPSDEATAPTALYPQAQAPLTAALTKTLSAHSGTRYSATPRTVRLTLNADRTSPAAVSRPTEYVLEDDSPAFWDQFDLIGLESLSGITSDDTTAGYTAAVQYLVDGTWSDPVSSDLPPGQAATMPPLPDGASTLPDGVDLDDVTGVRVVFTAPDGAWFDNRVVGGFEGVTAVFTVSPRTTLRSQPAVEVPTGTVTNVVTGSVAAEHLGVLPLDPASDSYTVLAGVADATVTKTPASTTTGPGVSRFFTLTATNSGDTPLDNPVLTDVFPTDASGPLLVYNLEGDNSTTVRLTPSDGSLSSVTPVVTELPDGAGVAVSFPGGRLMPGETVAAVVPLAVRVGAAPGGTLTNQFRLTADGGLTRTATANIIVKTDANYVRTKQVREDLADGQQPTGVVNVSGSGMACASADGFYSTPCLVRTRPGGTETWRMSVLNSGNVATQALTLVDVLPFPGDTGTSAALSFGSRGSVWAAEYLGDLQVTGAPAGSTTTVSYLVGDATCVYSGDVTSADPFGTTCPASAWTPADEVEDLSSVRGVRIDVDMPTTLLQPGEAVTATFRTRSASAYDTAAADVDAPAWNSMVVTTASAMPGGTTYQTLEPNKAGVAVDRAYAVGDIVWFDQDRDGVQGADEHGLAGVTVRLYAAGGTDPVATTLTDADGWYTFDGLPAGDYRIAYELAAADAQRYRFTSALADGSGAGEDSDADPTSGWTGTFTLAADAPHVRQATAADRVAASYVDPTLDAGVVERPVRVGDRVWVDADKNGVQDEGEAGIGGVVLTLTDEDGRAVTDLDGHVVGPVTTDASGAYVFENLPPGRYTVAVDRFASRDALLGYSPTHEGGTADRELDSSTWTAGSLVLVGGAQDLSLDFGFVLADDVQLPVRKTVAERADGRITWDITVLSAGTQDAYAGFTVIDTLPTSLRFVSASGTDMTCAADGQTVTCAHDGSLAAGEQVTVTVVTDLVERTAGVTNTALVDVTGRGYLFDVLAAEDSAISDPTAADLAATGADGVWQIALMALLALLAGAGIVIVTRRRRTTGE